MVRQRLNSRMFPQTAISSLYIFRGRLRAIQKKWLYIAEKTGAEIYEIDPLVPYPTEYTPTTEVAAKEKEENARPEIKNPIDVSNYS